MITIQQYYSDKKLEDVEKSLDSIASIENCRDSIKGFHFVKCGNNYKVYYKYRESMPSYDRFGFNYDEPFFKYNYFVLEPFLESSGQHGLSLKIIQSQRTWDCLKLFVCAPLITVLIISGILYFFDTFSIDFPNIYIYLISTTLAYSGTLINILCNKESVVDFENNAIPMLRNIVEAVV